MIWISSRKLEYALAEEKLNSWAKVKYLILPAILGVLSGGPFYIIRPHYGVRIPNIDMLALVIYGIISAFLAYSGIKECFYTNKSFDDKDFFERFIILSVPPLFQVAALTIILTLTFAIAISKLREEIPFLFKHASMFSSLLGPVVTYIYYLLIRNSIIRFGELIEEKNQEKETAT